MPSYNNLPARSDFFKGKLFQQMVDDLRLAGNAKRTVYGYVRAVRQLADFCRCCPEKVTEEQLRQWLLHLKVEKRHAYGSLRVAFSGIKFFLPAPAGVTGKRSAKPGCRTSRRCPKC